MNAITSDAALTMARHGFHHAAASPYACACFNPTAWMTYANSAGDVFLHVDGRPFIAPRFIRRTAKEIKE